MNRFFLFLSHPTTLGVSLPKHQHLSPAAAVQTNNLPQADIHLLITQMPVTSTVSTNWETIISYVLMALAMTIGAFSPPHLHIYEPAPFPTTTIMYASASSVLGINICRLVSNHLESSTSTVGCLAWGASVGAVAGAGVGMVGLY
jgi:hypothetical protein